MPEVLQHIDFDKLRTIVLAGVRRTSVLLAMGTNASNLDPPISHVLSDRFTFEFVPREVSAKTARHFADEFEGWIITNGLRDLIEGFSSFLGLVNGICWQLDNQPFDRREFDRAQRAFDRGGVSTQLSQLVKQLAMEDRFSRMFNTMNAARNCLAHRQGIIGAEDVQDDGTLVLSWQTRHVVLEDGTDLSTLLSSGQSFKTDREQAVIFALVERAKVFQLGEIIRLTRYELAEICFGVVLAVEFIIGGLVRHALRCGVKVTVKDQDTQVGQIMI